MSVILTRVSITNAHTAKGFNHIHTDYVLHAFEDYLRLKFNCNFNPFIFVPRCEANVFAKFMCARYCRKCTSQMRLVTITSLSRIVKKILALCSAFVGFPCLLNATVIESGFGRQVKLLWVT